MLRLRTIAADFDARYKTAARREIHWAEVLNQVPRVGFQMDQQTATLGGRLGHAYQSLLAAIDAIVSPERDHRQPDLLRALNQFVDVFYEVPGAEVELAMRAGIIAKMTGDGSKCQSLLAAELADYKGSHPRKRRVSNGEIRKLLRPRGAHVFLAALVHDITQFESPAIRSLKKPMPEGLKPYVAALKEIEEKTAWLKPDGCWLLYHAHRSRKGDETDNAAYATGMLQSRSKGHLRNLREAVSSLFDWVIGSMSTPCMPVGERPTEERDDDNDQLHCVHSDDFRSVCWFGTRYEFSPNQAAAVRVLWEAWERGTPSVSSELILELVGANQNRLSVVFRKHPAWNDMIVKGGTRGTYRLAEKKPPRTEKRS